MSLQTVRIAVCQIACHPALAIGDRDYMAEPFLSKPGTPALADFVRRSLDMSELQEACRESYLGWHAKRVTAIVEWIKGLDPRPHLLVLPEGSIPSELLTFLNNVSQETGMAIFGGTHTLRLTHDQVKLYKSLGIRKHDLERLSQVRQQPSVSVLPIFSAGAAFFHPKKVPSIFELVDVSRPLSTLLPPEAIELRIANEPVRILPLVCSEALQHTNFPNDIDLAVIPAFNDGIEPYVAIMKHLSTRRIPCVFCNDGHFGQSCVQTPLDKRPDYWWWDEPHQGRLPPGDAVLVIDVHFQYLAPQVGVSNPQTPVTLVALSQVAYSGQKGATFSISQSLQQISRLADNTAQAHRLNEIIEEGQGTPLLRIKLAHLYRLARNGTASAYWWNALANDCFVTDISDLIGVEALMAEKCHKANQKLLQDAQVEDAALLGTLHLFDRSCSSLCSPDSERKPIPASASQLILDRTDETRIVQEFLEHPHQAMLIVVGLDGIGKTSVVNQAISQTGRRIHRLAIESDSTLEYIGEWLLRCFGVNDRPPSGKPSDAVLTEWITPYIRRDNIIVIERGQLLLAHGIWRDTKTADFLVQLAGILKKQGSKLIVESSFQFDLPSAEPASIRRYRIGGLERDPGSLLLDQHLRRSGVDPNNYDRSQRQEVVTRLGGHPLALIIASEYIEQKGLGPVLTELRGRRGVHYEIVRRVLKDLELSHEQKVILSLLRLARSPLRADVLAGVVDFDPLPPVRQLIQLSFVERSKNDNIEIVSLLRGIDLGQVLTDALVQKFHRIAAQFFLALAPQGDRVANLRCTVEARYHGLLSDQPTLAPDLPGIIDGALGAANALANADKLEDAKAIIDQLITDQPSAEIYELAALVYAGLGECAEALVFAKEAAGMDRDRVWILTEVGRRSMHIHREDLARNAIDIAKAIGHDSPFVAVLEGNIQLNTDRSTRRLIPSGVVRS